MTDRAVFWFRRDLSLDDNLAWASATSENDEVLPLYVLDQRLLAAAGPHRRRLLLGHVRELDLELRAHGGRLTVVEGKPEHVLPQLAREHRARTVWWNADVTIFAKRRDRAVSEALRHEGLLEETAFSTLVHSPGSILTSAGSVPRVFSHFHKQWVTIPYSGVREGGAARIVAVDGEQLPVLEGEPPFPVGPAAAASRVAGFARIVDRYDDDRDRPDLAATSHLSVDLRFGAISPRSVVRALDGPTKGRRAFTRQLAWRDWYAHLFHERPELAHQSQQSAYDDLIWRNDPAEIEAWTEGRTGYPIVDAAMRELSATGWMHNRLRLITASFLVKDLLVDWRIGERHFRELLIDGDVPQNAGNWQWCAGTGPDAAPYFRVFNPITQAQRLDPDGDYVRRWLPELARVSGPAIHEPWKLRPLDLAEAGIKLTETYPAPIVDHAFARERALASYTAARDTARTMHRANRG